MHFRPEAILAPIGALALIGALTLTGAAWAQQVRMLVQSSPLAGFRYHAALDAFAQMRLGDRLELHRERDNAYDTNAVRVEWRGMKLGYVPRRENAALAWAMDRDEPVHARVSALRQHRNPRERVRFEVYVE
jgi:hypothetical protein